MSPYVASVRSIDDCRLDIEFENDERRVFDAKPYLHRGIFVRLLNRAVFAAARRGWVSGMARWIGLELRHAVSGEPADDAISRRRVGYYLTRWRRILASRQPGLALPTEVGLEPEPRRLDMFFMSGRQGGAFAEAAKEMTERVKGLGPNPLKVVAKQEVLETP